MTEQKEKCQASIPRKSRIRHWYNFSRCENPAKFKVTEKNGTVHLLCGVHARALKGRYYIDKIEPIEE